MFPGTTSHFITVDFSLSCRRRLLLLLIYCQNLRKNQNHLIKILVMKKACRPLYLEEWYRGVGTGQQFEHEGQDQALARRCHVEVGRQRRLLRLLPRTFRGVLPGLQNPGR